MPKTAYDVAAKHFNNGRVGTVFNSKESHIGIKIEDLLKKEAAM